jgi:hypothetical protein
VANVFEGIENELVLGNKHFFDFSNKSISLPACGCVKTREVIQC